MNVKLLWPTLLYVYHELSEFSVREGSLTCCIIQQEMKPITLRVFRLGSKHPSSEKWSNLNLYFKIIIFLSS